MKNIHAKYIFAVVVFLNVVVIVVAEKKKNVARDVKFKDVKTKILKGQYGR